jgi:glutathionyl-hydroquinone reductase
MGLLIEGRWQDQWYESSKDGAFQREQAQRRHWVTADGRRARRVKAVSAKPVAITSMCPSPARGPTAR